VQKNRKLFIPKPTIIGYMWILKLKLTHDKFFLGQLAVKHKVDLIGYPLSYYKDKNYLYLTTAGFMVGDEENKKEFLKDIKKRKELVKLEKNGDFIINVTKQSSQAELVYDPKLIKPCPDFISKEGYHIWEFGSWNKEPLMKIIKFARKHHKGEILKLKQEKIKNISFSTFMPDLSKKQKQALELAIKEGYYNYPRKIDVHELAKLMKVSYSTYQEHLRKAEGKIIPTYSK